MEAPDAAVLAMACGLAAWNRSAAFCSWCGSPMAPSCGGHVRLCTSGSRSCRPIYPRIDPAAIMLVTCGDFLLLGHQNRCVCRGLLRTDRLAVVTQGCNGV